MPAFRRVDARQAGPAALGILVPPGVKTLVILRPHGLEWDLLPARWAGDAGSAPAFCHFGRDEAVLIARQLQQCLEESVAAGVNPVETFGSAARQQLQVWVRTSTYVWILCRRVPGQLYEPLVFTSHEEVGAAGARIIPYVHPAPDADQEYYFNTQSFTRA
jgi:hypothetical protein